MDRKKRFVLWFDEINNDDVALVGGKNASLGEMYRELTSRGVLVPNGFALTAHAYVHFVEKAGLAPAIRDVLKDLDVTDTRNVEERGRKVRNLILGAEFPQEVVDALLENYRRLEGLYGANVDVAVRSSGTAEDLPNASFAGQMETYLNVVGERELLAACKKCMASLFTDRAMCYREHNKYDHFSVALSLSVQKMVRSDKACSGVMFSVDTESGFSNVVLVTGSWGLGENIVQGAVNPDEFLVFKPTLHTGHKPIISRKMGEKELTMIYHATKQTKNVFTEKTKREMYCLSDDEVLTLARWACIIETHYTERRGAYTPMDMEWAKDGLSGELFIVQARPETVQSRKKTNELVTYSLKAAPQFRGKVVARGRSIGASIGTGKARVLHSLNEMHSFQAGEVLVAEMTDPDWESILSKCSGVVTNRGGRTCHAAIISRELGIPCVVGCGNATDAIETGTGVTIDSSQGQDGFVYDQINEFEKKTTSLDDLERPNNVKIMLNLANPEQAFDLSFMPNDGVGLLRMEFLCSNYIKVHPMALLHPEKVGTPATLLKIAELAKNYPSLPDFFVDMLAMGIAQICAAFHPKRVILRFSDFKTNEYAHLLGGDRFEPSEDNPMIGWRGASRYCDPNFRDAFALECKAVLRVRETMGLKNLQVMIPFPRTVAEVKRVIGEMERNGLRRQLGANRPQDDLQIIGMCEIPSNVFCAEEFLEVLDGYSIGSNDLTQLILGCDRNSEVLADTFDERDPAVKKAIKHVIGVCNRLGKYVGICGQGPSDYPDFAEFLVEEGIQSMSLNPDSMIPTMIALASAAKEKEKKQ